MHTVDGLIFEEKLVVFRDSHEEEDCRDVLKAVDPLLSLRPLSTNVKHAISQFANDECSLSDASGLDTGAQNILVIGQVVRLSDAGDVVEVARRVG